VSASGNKTSYEDVEVEAVVLPVAVRVTMNIVLHVSYRALAAGSTTQENRVTPMIRICGRRTWSLRPSQLQHKRLHCSNMFFFF
jgi:hypothetical protein